MHKRTYAASHHNHCVIFSATTISLYASAIRATSLFHHQLGMPLHTPVETRAIAPRAVSLPTVGLNRRPSDVFSRCLSRRA
ncbi:hypothetical protein COEREDRAFT_90410 [Coemansia reversa NRRL 1564]|uniref:Uncharacterized protein n=1 Tax=Coemansia reversa (strain ATCC 12441 / NRRL 1564) TaxID=763665 RepID=A0A2G5BL38_COERN|nr:hypothetical protein COEREDRAFT_90410 [Coemansia reversa NRRL 1564]|eukprot:PIA19735.1 hypothetical protein COEREDRAFT_90410 [Coemansia reversa NRRL 1564]